MYIELSLESFEKIHYLTIFPPNEPLCPGASWAGTVDTCVNQSVLWHHFQALQLMENMRVHVSGDVRLDQSNMCLLSLGDGTAPVVNDTDMIKLPEDLCSVIDKDDKKKSMKEFCPKIFLKLDHNIRDEIWLEARAILVLNNRKGDKINELMVEKMSGKIITLHSSDSLNNDSDAYQYNVKYMNIFNLYRLPSSHLTLNPVIPVMLRQ